MTSKIVYQNGIPMIQVGERLVSPAAFRSFRPTPSNVSQFHRIGVSLHQMLVAGRINALGIRYSNYGDVWVGDGKYDFTAFENQLTMFQKFAPNDYYNVMLQLDMPEWWLKEHPEDEDSFRKLGNAVFNERWKQAAADYLQAFLRYCEEKHSDCIWAYSFSCGYATEWFSNEFGAADEKKASAYRKTLGDPQANVPDLTVREKGDTDLFRKPRSEQLRYLDFSCKQTPELICFFAEKAQEVLKHRKLIGMFFGYGLIYQSKFQNLWLTNGYEKVWRSPDIDMLYSPAAYNVCRALENCSSYQVAVDSIALNGKLYLHEIDHRTPLAKYPLENGAILDDCYETFEETREVLRREICNTLVKNAALWWFDFTGGYYCSPEYEQEMAFELEIIRKLSQEERRQTAEVAVFIDPTSYLHFYEDVNLLPVCTRGNVSSLHKSGYPFQIFNLSDIAQLELERYRMLIFLSPVHPSSEVSAFLKKHAVKGQARVFVYAAGYASDTENSSKNLSDFVGMEISEKRSDKAEKIRGEGFVCGFECPAAPLFSVTDASAQPLGYYADGSVGMARKGDHYYIGSGFVSPEAWHFLGKQAGVHIYAEPHTGLAVCSQFISSHAMREEVTLYLPQECECMELFHNQRYFAMDGILQYTASKGTTMLFQILK